MKHNMLHVLNSFTFKIVYSNIKNDKKKYSYVVNITINIYTMPVDNNYKRKSNEK